MKRIELLSPAGNFDMLKVAINCGADAVYLAGEKFGARKFAQNFNDEEIVEAIKYAHLYGVKVYVTANTLVKDDEVNDFMHFIEFIYINGVDAVLMQDLGMMALVRRTFPNLEIHASTQFHNHNNSDLEFLKNMGIKRAVLARELSLEEIKNMNVDIEKEVFVHGALCICYSGECLMSSIVMKRSGNEGACAGMCRLPYKLVQDDSIIDTKGEYLLSPKELCSINRLKEIIEAGVDSIKIEGRMKSIEYVGYVTKLYRRLINDYYSNKKLIINKNEIDNLKVLYNRGFTEGYLFNKFNDDFINQTTSNHIGIEVGKVLEVNSKKIKIELSSYLNQGDAIKFKEENKGMYVNFIYNKNENFISSGKPKEIIYLDNKINLKNKCIVLKTIDTKLINEIHNYDKKRIPIDIRIICKLSKPIEIILSDGKNTITEKGLIVQEAKNNPTTINDIKSKINKLRDTIYEIENETYEIDKNIFIPLKEINNIRRKLIEQLNNLRSNKKINYVKKEPVFNIKKINTSNKLNVLIDKEEDYSFKQSVNYYTEDINIYEKYKTNKNIYFRLPRVVKGNISYKNDNIILSDIGTLYKNSNNNMIIDIYGNVTNIYTLAYLYELGAKKVGISPEFSTKESYKLYNNFRNKFGITPNIDIFIYGKIELMILKHCIINSNLNDSYKCSICMNNKKYYLKDRNDKLYRIKTNKCLNTILNYKISDNIDEIKKIEGLNYYISLMDIEDKNIIKKFIKEW